MKTNSPAFSIYAYELNSIKNILGLPKPAKALQEHNQSHTFMFLPEKGNSILSTDILIKFTDFKTDFQKHIRTINPHSLPESGISILTKTFFDWLGLDKDPSRILDFYIPEGNDKIQVLDRAYSERQKTTFKTFNFEPIDVSPIVDPIFSILISKEELEFLLKNASAFQGEERAFDCARFYSNFGDLYIAGFSRTSMFLGNTNKQVQDFKAIAFEVEPVLKSLPLFSGSSLISISASKSKIQLFQEDLLMQFLILDYSQFDPFSILETEKEFSCLIDAAKFLNLIKYPCKDGNFITFQFTEDNHLLVFSNKDDLVFHANSMRMNPVKPITEPFQISVSTLIWDWLKEFSKAKQIQFSIQAQKMIFEFPELPFVKIYISPLVDMKLSDELNAILEKGLAYVK